MKKIFLILLSLLLITSCGKKKTEEAVIEEEIEILEKVELNEEVELEEMAFDPAKIETLEEGEEIVLEIVEEESILNPTVNNNSVLVKENEEKEEDEQEKSDGMIVDSENKTTGMTIDEFGVIHLPVVERE